jgi:hypothetical protein
VALLFGAGCWVMGLLDSWFLVSGFWFLVSGFWFLDYYLLIIA